jgi:hypothetical protein
MQLLMLACVWILCGWVAFAAEAGDWRHAWHEPLPKEIAVACFICGPVGMIVALSVKAFPEYRWFG